MTESVRTLVLLALGVGLPAVLGAAIGIGFAVARRLLYFPARYPFGLWDLQEEIAAHDVWLHSADGGQVHGWYGKASERGPVTLFLHGNTGNVTHQYRHFHEIVRAGSSILMIDYRGYGKSAGVPSEEGLCRDAEAAYDYLGKTGRRPEDIIVHGQSLGCAVAVDLAARRACGGLILEAPFAAASQMARTIVPILGPLFVRSFDSRRKIAAVRAPILFIHGEADEVVPLSFGQELFAKAPEPKSFWMVDRSGHNNIIETAGDAYAERLRSFYASLGASAHATPMWLHSPR
jgi:pimeloyl-ACP methyl ester carboxylesterase